MKNFHLWWLSVLGLSFWYFLAFPFASYHESYEWLAQVNSLDLQSLIFQKVGHYHSHRPLGQLWALTLYTLGGKSLAAIQLFNYAVTALAFAVFLRTCQEKKLLSLTLMAAGGLYFVVFTYLFHLHGFYYAPLLLQLAVFFHLGERGGGGRVLLPALATTLVAALFHPFAILLLFFFLAGLVAQKQARLTPSQYCGIALLAVGGITLLRALVPGQHMVLDRNTVAGIVEIYQALEFHPVLSLGSFALALLTILSLDRSPRLKHVLSASLALLSASFLLTGLPVTLLWILACIVKMAAQRRWVMTTLLLATLLFPLFTGTDSPHLRFMVVALGAVATPLGWQRMEGRIRFATAPTILALTLLMAAVLFSVRQDIPIPVISKQARPLLIEMEKASQLEQVALWLIGSNYRDYGLNLVSTPEDLSSVCRSGKTRMKVPTSNAHLNEYLDTLRGTGKDQTTSENRLNICFGGSVEDIPQPVFTVSGRWAGQASVFLPLN